MKNRNGEDTKISPEDSFEEVENVDSAMEELNGLRVELADCKDLLIRARAENENQRKRLNREVENARNFGIQNIVSNLLAAKDSLEKGLDIAYMENGADKVSLIEGMSSALRLFNDAFKNNGVQEINPLGKKFDPEMHEALTINKTEKAEPNMVLSVFQNGYTLNGRLIRPARVEVSEGQ